MNTIRPPAGAQRGVTLIELMVVIVVIGILGAVGMSSYSRYVIRGSRSAAQTELVQLASVQEKIYLNSNAYSKNLTAAYTGQSNGGLGKTSGMTNDSKYTVALATDAAAQSFTLIATPVSTSTQKNDGAITIDSTGKRLWNSKAW